MKKNIIIVLIVISTFFVKQIFTNYLMLNRLTERLVSLVGDNIISYSTFLAFTLIPIIGAEIILNTKYKKASLLQFKLTEAEIIVLTLALLPIIFIRLTAIDGGYSLFNLDFNLFKNLLNAFYYFIVYIWFLFYQIYNRTNLSFFVLMLFSLIVYVIFSYNTFGYFSFEKIIRFIGLSWLFIEWKKNILIPIVLLMFIYMSSTLFKLNYTYPIIGIVSNITIIWTIMVTIIIKNYRKEKFEISLKDFPYKSN